MNIFFRSMVVNVWIGCYCSICEREREKERAMARKEVFLRFSINRYKFWMGGSIYTDKWNWTIYQYKFSINQTVLLDLFIYRQRKITWSVFSVQWAKMRCVCLCVYVRTRNAKNEREKNNIKKRSWTIWWE